MFVEPWLCESLLFTWYCLSVVLSGFGCSSYSNQVRYLHQSRGPVRFHGNMEIGTDDTGGRVSGVFYSVARDPPFRTNDGGTTESRTWPKGLEVGTRYSEGQTKKEGVSFLDPATWTRPHPPQTYGSDPHHRPIPQRGPDTTNLCSLGSFSFVEYIFGFNFWYVRRVSSPPWFLWFLLISSVRVPPLNPNSVDLSSYRSSSWTSFRNSVLLCRFRSENSWLNTTFNVKDDTQNQLFCPEINTRRHTTF